MSNCDWFGRAVLTIGAVISSVDAASAQCLDWSSGFELPGFENSASSTTVYDFEVYDDGSGPAFYAAGFFGTANGAQTRGLAKWDGNDWSPVGGGFSGFLPYVYSIVVCDFGSGPVLIAAGQFTSAGGVGANNIAQWNGTSWAALGVGLDERATTTVFFDDGSGPALYVSGFFSAAGGLSSPHLAKWNGSTWTAIASDLEEDVAIGTFDDGSGAALYVGGDFSTINGTTVNNVAKWNGSSWSALSSGTNDNVTALFAFDDGSGPALYVGGNFTTAGGFGAPHVAKWNGTDWSALDAGLNSYVTEFEAFDDGSGSALYVVGDFTDAGGVSAQRVAKWDGAAWSALGAGFDPRPYALGAFDDGSGGGTRLYAGGSFKSSGSAALNRFARWDGSAWIAPSYGRGLDQTVLSLAVYDEGAGPKLYAGGWLTTAGHVATKGIARWDGADWSDVGGGIAGQVYALEVFDDGSGEALFAGGDFLTAGGGTARRIAKWNGTSWSEVGNGFDNPVYDLTVYDSGTGPALYACGDFTSTPGLLLKRVAKWNGTSWSALGTGMNAGVSALTVYDNGSGPVLVAGGLFALAGSTTVSNIAKWNGSSWSALGSGVNALVFALTSFDAGLGGGSELYAGGQFTIAGGSSALRIAKWNGSAWSAVSTGMNNWVTQVDVIDDGSGARLCAGGSFTTAGGTAANRVATWNGTSWSAVGSGTNDIVEAFAGFDDGTGGGTEIYLGGAFSTAGGKRSEKIARFGACRPGAAYCFGDDLDPFVTTDCPCLNFGGGGRGCANSNPLLGGARLTATGTTTPNTVLFTCDGIPNNTLCTFFRNIASAGAGSVYGDGVRCLIGTGIRFGQQNSGQNGNPPNTVSAGAATIAPGVTRYYQVQYRNPAAFCTAATFNASNGYQISW